VPTDRRDALQDLTRALRDAGAIAAPRLQSPPPFAVGSPPHPPFADERHSAPPRRSYLSRWPLYVAVIVVLVAALAVPLAFGIALVQAAAPIRFGPGTAEQSANWAGYVLTGTRFTSIKATWTVPQVAPGTQPTEVAAFWVGLDGRGTEALEQIGTLSGMLGGTEYYAAWFEIVPNPPAYLTMDLKPGDVVTASVTAAPNDQFRLRIYNHRNGQQYTTFETSKGAELVTAEVVAEAPGTLTGLAPLPDFAYVHFGQAYANGRPIGTFHWNRLTMAAGVDVQAETSPLGRDAASFNVIWRHQ